MLIALCLQLLVANSPPRLGGDVFNGQLHQLDVRIPAAASDVHVDGELDEPAWRAAALLTGFSMYQPVDGRPAPDSTEVLIWHSAEALYVGIRAFEPHAPVRATLADRDKIAGDDNIQLFLDTFNDRRRAFVFAVNPLGIQADGMRSEGSGAGLAGGVPGQNDLSPDYTFESKGHVTPWGYQVEMRIPFTALRYAPGSDLTWGINIQRTVQHSGYVETWTPAHRASASFLSESGVLSGLTGLHRGRVLELNPEATAHANGQPTASVTSASAASGSPAATGGVPQTTTGWAYASGAQLGGNVKWDVNSALTLNGTIRPDFSQVESDATQIATDPRFALYYPEKRPFFIDGIEQFDVPNRLVYTRRIVQPLVAAKLTGTVSGADVAFLSAIDDRAGSATGLDRPRFDILRLRRDLPLQTTAGFLYTDRTEGADVNRVVSGDLHTVFKKLYYAQFQVAGSQTRSAGVTTAAPLWEGIVDRTGRTFGFHYSITGIADNFDAASGFVARRGIVQPGFKNRFTIYGPPGAVLENYTARVFFDGVWDYASFFRGASVLEGTALFEQVFTLHGGWLITLDHVRGTYAFDPRAYTSYATAGPTDTIAFQVPGRLPSATTRWTVTTPQFQHVAATVTANAGSNVDFLETDPAHRTDLSAVVDWTPTRQLRMHGSYAASTLVRRRDGERVATARIPRLAAEYQVSRPLFIRLVGQYDAEHRSALTDYATGLPILIRSGTLYEASRPQNSNDFRVDALVAYQPTPGTVVFLGYGDSMREPAPLAFSRLERTHDTVFAKISYLFR